MRPTFSQLRLRSLVLGTGLAALALKSSGAPGYGQFTVGATVVRPLSLQLSDAPVSLVVTEQDVQRGFVNSTVPLHVLIKGGGPAGFALDFLPLSNVLTGAAVAGLGQAVLIGPDGATYVQRRATLAPVALDLSFHLELTPGLAPGLYAFPLRLSVHPL
jgi:hypothetical protein